MKKVNKNNIVPEKLENYFKTNPNNDWEKFKNECQDGYKKILDEIKSNQGGVCCYCEITFHDDKGIRDDFRVEHFHPKSDTLDPNINWNLIWKNLLGCCHGGSDKSVLGAKRFIQNKKHRHSDVLKGEKLWDDEILNPLEIPNFPPIFKVDSDGEIKVLEDNCNQVNINIVKAQNCLDEEKLNLNSPILKGWRKNVIDNLRNQMIETEDIELIMENIEDLLSTYLLRDSNENYSPFFTTIRSYFEEDAEEFLKKNNYDG
ncbi:MAG TPA: TIGR02646 family protein [Bacteroidia bacterium]|nr:TIGR02646 family protein [Bacteroidia bacterium]